MREPDLSRVVADADVLAADVLVGGPSREALDHVRRHSWLTLVATTELLDDAEGLIADLADPELAADWRVRIEEECLLVEQEPGDHPGLAAAYHGDSGQLLTFAEGLRSAKAGASLRKYVTVSVKHPDAFARLFDLARVYPEVGEEEYPGPDRDPRA
jgi:hypothetical protein